MRSKTLLYLAAGLIAVILLAGAFSTGVVLGGTLGGNSAGGTSAPVVQALPTTALIPTPQVEEARPTAPIEAAPTSVPANTPQDLDTLFEPFWQTWKIVHEQYVDQPVDDETMMRGAIQGMLESLGDQHTSYMDPDQFKQANIPLEGEYEGIGAWVDPSGEFLTIVSPMPDSPAEKAGLRPGDEIIAVDGEDMTGIDGDLVIRRVLGPAGSKVTLTISRKSDQESVDPEIFDVEVERAHIVVPSVDSKMLDGNIAYVQLFSFGDTTTQDLRAALKDLMTHNPEGLILDLRNNGGGALKTAIEVGSEFVGDGVIMYEEYGDGTRDTYQAIPDGLATEIPLVVLINEGTASASEIVAGAIQDHGRGQLVGVTSFGKGSVQNWIPLQNNEGAVRVTIARWLTPDGRTIHEIGLTPDVEVKMPEDASSTEQDPQLDKAIELLTNG
jgi:carboxyl-terminal processing protease